MPLNAGQLRGPTTAFFDAAVSKMQVFLLKLHPHAFLLTVLSLDVPGSTVVDDR